MTDRHRASLRLASGVMVTTTIGPPTDKPQYQPPTTSKDIWAVQRPGPNDPVELEVARELRNRFTDWQSADSEWLNNSKFELDFLDDHWLEEETGRQTGRDMEAAGRAAFDIDLLNPAIDLVVNTSRINKVTANFIPLSEGADEATAEIRQGLYRNIERVSKAAIARETGYQLAVSVGRGYWRVIIEDDDGPTFSKHIGLQRVDNLQSIAMDPTVLDFCYADAEWGYAFDDLSPGRFRAEYDRDDTEPIDITGKELTDSDRFIWFPKGMVRVGEYFRKVWKKRTVWELPDGSEVWKDVAPTGIIPVREKDKLDYIIEWRKMTGTTTIEKREWPGRYIPIVVCIGREVFRGRKGKIHRGLIRPAIAPTRIHDVMFSRMVDAVGLSPLPHFLSYTGQLTPENKQIINTINRQPWSNVEIKPDRDADGRPLPLLGWVSPSPNTAAVVQAAELSSQKLDRVLNTYAPNRGQAIADQSGRAIREIKDSGDISHAAFPDNLNRAILHEAVIVNDLMDVVYTDKQAITITEPDEKTRRVLINQEYQDPRTGKTVKHVFGSSAKYGVGTTIAPYYPSQAREASQKLLDLASKFPQMANVLDLLVQDLGVPSYKKYADRLRPPGFKEQDDGPDVNELNQQVQQLTQVNEQGHQIIQKLLDKVKELGDKGFIEKLRIASQERIAAAGDRTTLLAAEMKAGQTAHLAVLNAELETILRTLENDSPGSPDHQPASDAGADQAPASTPGSPPAAANGPIAPPQQAPTPQAAQQ